MIAYYPFARARLTVSAAFSITVHALIILLMSGLALFPEVYTKPVQSLEVIIASSPSERSTEDALLEADKHQTGERVAQRPNKSAPVSTPQNRRILQTQGNAQLSLRPGFQDEAAWKTLPDHAIKHRAISAASHEARDAAYLARWRDRVEQFGTEYYQQQIKKTPISGEVRILVSIGPKGQLLDAQVRESSGSLALDKIALEILRKSAPFEPLPQEIRSDTDVLEIIRTWKFTTREGLRAG